MLLLEPSLFLELAVKSPISSSKLDDFLTECLGLDGGYRLGWAYFFGCFDILTKTSSCFAMIFDF